MSSPRQRRRADLAHFRRGANRSGGGLLTYLVQPHDPLTDAPRLHQAVSWWLDGLEARSARYCIVCDSWLKNRQFAGGILMSTQISRRTGVSVTGICSLCWNGTDDVPPAVEHAAERVFRAAVPRGKFVDRFQP